ncbi:GNAT family N-acetyltransferase [Streptomyces sp. NPDC005244]|uniref:GNAT family N-acetyltransferase n=1 Tax=Streptomyces sp. NPDC005244 TaxID=3364708 RepID=UPI0036BA78F7
MATPILSPMTFTPDEIADVVGIYASNPEYCRAAGEYDPERIEPGRVEADLREEARGEGCHVLLARDGEGRTVGLVCLLDRHPGDGYPWIGLLMVSGDQRRRGVGRTLVRAVEERFLGHGRDGLRLAVLENNSPASAFWSSLGWQEIDRRLDVRFERPCIVMHKQLTRPPITWVPRD